MEEKVSRHDMSAEGILGEDCKARRRKRRGEILGNIISLQHEGGGEEGFCKI